MFGKIIKGQMLHNDAGKLIHNIFENLNDFYINVNVDAFVVMPNHIHAIIALGQKGQRCVLKGRPDVLKGPIRILKGRTRRSASTGDSLSDVVKYIKTFAMTCYIRGVHQNKWEPFYKRLWQRGYYEHIIRNEEYLQKIREYIIQNPLNWDHDPINS